MQIRGVINQVLKARLAAAGLALACATAPAATITVGSWTPIFKGVELASGSQAAVTSGEKNQQVLCLRVDLTDPDVALLTTPRCDCGLETAADYTSNFLQQNGLQVAINGGFYSSSTGPSDSPLGTPENVYGLAISGGTVVSAADMPAYAACLLFTSNNAAYFVPTNYPGTNTTGIYTAISGNCCLLVNGVNVQAATPNDLDPRTAMGLSQDRRYLFLLTIDGRQTGWSDGADFHDTGEWLKRFGASDGINLDGGGSTTMCMADCQGNSVRLNRSSFVAAYGRERNIGHNFGVSAKPLPSELKNLVVDPGGTTANITWQTDFPATTQVEYGLTSAYGSATALDSRLLRKHVASLAGLASGSNYFFRALSTDSGGVRHTQACQFTTLSSLVKTQVFGFSQTWRHTTNNLDSVNWKAANYNDSSWLGPGPGLLYVENNAAVAPKGTALPPTYGQTIPRTYYFRTHFSFSGSSAGVSLVFTNYVDDGAVFYLNGAEIYRLRMPAAPTVIVNSTAATGVPGTGAQAGDAISTNYDVFTISGSLLANLVQGDNVLAVEVHNYGTLTSGDIVFGSSLTQYTPATVAPQLNAWTESGGSTLFWNGEGFTLQQSTNLMDWSDVPGPVTTSPYAVPQASALYFRLKK